ncbi:MAG TPA: DUF1992 domain-containing protein [Chloroflexia bacterium]|nr:DUF1992 domain-containing protein [Chloroflexia bacterium]
MAKERKKISGPISEAEFAKPQKPLPMPFERWIDRLIHKAEAEGKFDNLANHGKPLKLEEENPYVEEDMRLAYKIMGNAGFSPPWVDMEKEVNAEIERLTRDREQHRRWIKRRLNEIKMGPYQVFMRDIRLLASSHDYWLKLHSERLTELNQKIYTFNHICPVENLHKAPVQVASLMEEYEKSCPAIPKL